ncbi:MAG: cell division protein ZapA, partial [Treponema sp.]|nr:cell division protein ZapA [Treponema sp.]
MAKSDFIIDILGTTITITADEDPEYLNKLLGKYKKTIDNVKNISGLKDPLKLAVLTGFLLCDDLEKAGSLQLKTEDSSEAEELTMGMISRLEDALKITETENEETEANPQKINVEAETKLQKIDEEAIPQKSDEEAPDEKNFKIYKLQNTIKNYAWGSTEWIPALLEEKNFSRIPWAELWMGVNSAGPSQIMPDDAGESPHLLSELIVKDKEFYLGKDLALNFGNLPFLFKVLAAAKPLSIQAHPNLLQAREGFERENR